MNLIKHSKRPLNAHRKIGNFVTGFMAVLFITGVFSFLASTFIFLLETSRVVAKIIEVLFIILFLGAPLLLIIHFFKKRKIYVIIGMICGMVVAVVLFSFLLIMVAMDLFFSSVSI